MIEEPITDEVKKKRTSIWVYVFLGMMVGFWSTLYQEISSFDDWPKAGQIAFRMINLFLLCVVALLTRLGNGQIRLVNDGNHMSIRRLIVLILASLLGAIVALGIDQNFGDY